MNRTTALRLRNPNLMPKNRASGAHKPGEPWKDSRGRWCVRAKCGTARRCDPPEQAA